MELDTLVTQTGNGTGNGNGQDSFSDFQGYPFPLFYPWNHFLNLGKNNL